MTDHPRQYKVDRNVPGIDFGRDAVSYHRTLALAANAADRFWHDERFVGWINRNAGDSFVNIYERDPTVPRLPQDRTSRPPTKGNIIMTTTRYWLDLTKFGRRRAGVACPPWAMMTRPPRRMSAVACGDGTFTVEWTC